MYCPELLEYIRLVWPSTRDVSRCPQGLGGYMPCWIKKICKVSLYILFTLEPLNWCILHLPILVLLKRWLMLTLAGLWLLLTSFPKGVGLTLNVAGRWLLQLFHHTNTGGFMLLSLEYDKCATPSTLRAQGRATHSTNTTICTEYQWWYSETDSDWSQSFGKQQVKICSQLVSIIPGFLGIRGLVSV